MTKPYLQSIAKSDLDGTLMWVANVNTELIEDMTPDAAAIGGFTVDEVIGSDLEHLRSKKWWSRPLEINRAQNLRVVESGIPETRTWWIKAPEGKIRKFIVTMARIDPS